MIWSEYYGTGVGLSENLKKVTAAAVAGHIESHHHVKSSGRAKKRKYCEHVIHLKR